MDWASLGKVRRKEGIIERCRWQEVGFEKKTTTTESSSRGGRLPNCACMPCMRSHHYLASTTRTKSTPHLLSITHRDLQKQTDLQRWASAHQSTLLLIARFFGRRGLLLKRLSPLHLNRACAERCNDDVLWSHGGSGARCWGNMGSHEAKSNWGNPRERKQIQTAPDSRGAVSSQRWGR